MFSRLLIQHLLTPSLLIPSYPFSSISPASHPFLSYSDESGLNLTTIDEFLKELYGAKDNGVKAFGNNSLAYGEESNTNWDYYSAFFFSTTVVTTIGFGNIAPRYRFWPA